jgi:hypothetical protein
MRRCNEEGWRPSTPGKRWEKKRVASRKKERSDSIPLSCWKSARVRTSESESFLRDPLAVPVGVEDPVGVVDLAEQNR